jgi:hypothetical protein
MTAQIEERAHDRDTTIKAIRAALKTRSGKTWSVKGGRGTAWGWIRIEAPPARCTFKHREKPGFNGGYAQNWRDQYEEYDSGEPGHSMSDAETAELATLLNIEKGQASGGVGVPASSDYRQEYIDRAEGRAPRVIAEPYWD